MTQYEHAQAEYARLGVDTEAVLNKLVGVPISIHCWQGDDVGGFESPDAVLAGGGIQTTGNFPGKARNIEELRADLDKVVSLVPGVNRLNLHASYGEFGGEFVDRDQIEEQHYAGWVQWAKERGLGIDFNCTCFSHPYAEDGFTLSSKNPVVRNFWIEHVKRCRRIAAWIGQQQGTPCILDTWIPDGAKDYTVDKIGYRRILRESLDEIFATEYSPKYMRDALETKLFGIGSEAYVVGSHEFYMNYAARSGKMLCIDMGHFHVGEDISDKISSILLFDDEILLHISRPMRWDSDHVVLFNDNVRAVSEELVRSGKLDDAHIGLDYFDASINRVGAWVTGIRSMRKALLYAMLEPLGKLRQYEEDGNGYAKMALLENCAVMPFGAVWEELCSRCGVPSDMGVLDSIMEYEANVQGLRV